MVGPIVSLVQRFHCIIMLFVWKTQLNHWIVDTLGTLIFKGVLFADVLYIKGTVAV